MSLTKKVESDEGMFSTHGAPCVHRSVTLDKLFKLSKHGFPHLLHGLNDRANLIKVLFVVNDKKRKKEAQSTPMTPIPQGCGENGIE